MPSSLSALPLPLNPDKPGSKTHAFNTNNSYCSKRTVRPTQKTVMIIILTLKFELKTVPSSELAD